jgi:ATP-dependent Lon protease
MVEMGKGRCILYFDELDKACSKHGTINEITSILIHLTDPNTNKAFQDRFFQGIDFPLDKIIFIASYNDSNKIDPILLDRLIELEVKPYNVEDKINILRDFIIPELKENIGFNKNIKFNDDEIKRFIYDFTAESGVRDLKHKMEQVLLNINKQDLFNETNSDTIQLSYDIILKYLGEKNKNHRKMIPVNNKVGYVNGLYATTSGGGGITCIEICPMKTGDNFQLKLTGSMGDVMKESIQVAFTRACAYIFDHSSKFNITDVNKHIKDKFPFGFHIHAPEGATPKDGPSAGAAFTVGFVSAILEIPTNRTVAMTGEMNLSGEVTKIGGLVYKLIGAKFAGVKTVLVPKQNEIDIKEILETNKDLFNETFNYVYIETLSDVIENTLVIE